MIQSKDKSQSTWYERIEIARKHIGKSQKDMAEQIGCSQNMFSIIEKGDLKNPKKSNLIEPIKSILIEEGISKEWLDKGVGEMSMKVIQEDYRKKYEIAERERLFLKEKVSSLENTVNKILALFFTHRNDIPEHVMAELGKLQASSPKNANLFVEKKNNQLAA